MWLRTCTIAQYVIYCKFLELYGQMVDKALMAHKRIPNQRRSTSKKKVFFSSKTVEKVDKKSSFETQNDRIFFPNIYFPTDWNWWFDEALPAWIKLKYSPRENWKNKPFSKEDSRFFSKGILELSALFTDERPKFLPDYFQQARFRSAYLLYFFPLQAAKFIALFQMHAKAFESAILHSEQNGKLRIADVGSGPATASLAFLLWFLHLLKTEKPKNFKIPEIEIELYDSNRSILEDGKALLLSFSKYFPELHVKVNFEEACWWDAPSFMKEEYSLILFGNVLNEGNLSKSHRSDRKSVV